MKIQTFVNKHNVRADVEMVGDNPNMPDFEGYHYKVTLRMGSKHMTVPFSCGYACNWPEAVDVLNCLVSDAGSADYSFEDFCAELGYDEDSRKAERTYNAVVKQTAKLKTFLNSHYEEALRCEGL